MWAEGTLATGDAAEVRRSLRAWIAVIDADGALDLRIRAHTLCGEAADRLGLAQEARTEFETSNLLWSDPAALVWLRSRGNDAQSRAAIASVLDSVGSAVFHRAHTAQRESDAATGRLESPPVVGSDPKARGEQIAAYRAWTQRVLAPWMKAREASLGSVDQLYRKVLEIPPAPPVRWSVASAEAIGGMWADYVTQLRSLPVPVEPSAPSVAPDYQHTLLDPPYERFRMRARDAFTFCWRTSLSNRFFDASSARCEAWLARNHRHEFRALIEYVPVPQGTGGWLDDRRPPPRGAP